MPSAQGMASGAQGQVVSPGGLGGLGTLWVGARGLVHGGAGGGGQGGRGACLTDFVEASLQLTERVHFPKLSLAAAVALHLLQAQSAAVPLLESGGRICCLPKKMK